MRIAVLAESKTNRLLHMDHGQPLDADQNNNKLCTTDMQTLHVRIGHWVTSQLASQQSHSHITF